MTFCVVYTLFDILGGMVLELRATQCPIFYHIRPHKREDVKRQADPSRSMCHLLPSIITWLS